MEKSKTSEVTSSISGWYERFRPSLLLGFLLFSCLLLAFFLTLPFQQMGYNTAFENPDSPTNPILYIVFMLIFTGFILFMFKKGAGGGLRYFVYFGFGMLVFYVIQVPFAYFYFYVMDTGYATPWLALFSALAFSFLLMLSYIFWKDWRIFNVIGVLVAGGGAAMLGVNFSILPSLIFLSALAVYDFIAVYVTRHMIVLADGVIKNEVPIMVGVPKKRGVKRLPREDLVKKIERGEERSGVYMGLGDMIIPGVLMVSALAFLPLHPILGVWGARIVAIGTMGGIMGAYIFLSAMVMRGKPQAGLPFLNTGSVLGFILSYVMVYRDLGLGLS